MGVCLVLYRVGDLNYFREDFFTRTQTTYVPFSSEHFQSFLDAYTDSLNASWVPIETIDREVVKEAVQEGYRELPIVSGLPLPEPIFILKRCCSPG